MKKFDVFISYSRKDREIVFPLVKEFERLGLSVWIDLKGIESGVDFVDKIVSSIDRSEFILFMYTESSAEGGWTKKEILYAKDQGKPIIPILLEGRMPQRGWFKFLCADINCVDIKNPLQKESLFKMLIEHKRNGYTSLSETDYIEQDVYVSIEGRTFVIPKRFYSEFVLGALKRTYDGKSI